MSAVVESYDYELKIVDAFQKSNSLINLLLILLSCFVFFSFYVQYDSVSHLLYALGTLVAAVWMFRNYLRNIRGILFKRWVFFIIGFLMLFSPPGHWIGLFYLLIGVINIRMLRPVHLRFSQTGISLRSFFDRSFDWIDISYAVLKDGLFTLGLKDNRVIQYEIDTAWLPDEQEFNRYLGERLDVVV